MIVAVDSTAGDDGTPAGLARRALAITPAIADDPFTRTDVPGHRLGFFLRETVGRTAGTVPSFPADEWPLLVDRDDLPRGWEGLLGTAFDYWVRLRTQAVPRFPETRVALTIVPTRVRQSLLEMMAWASEPADDHAARCARFAVGDEYHGAGGGLLAFSAVLAFCDQMYRLGPAALESNPLSHYETLDDADPFQLLYDARPVLVGQLGKLAAVAEERLVPVLVAEGCRQPLLLDRLPLRAEADLLVGGGTVVDLKTNLGTAPKSGGPRRFTIDPELVRQLVGYALLADGRPGLRSRPEEQPVPAVEEIGVYAARYGLLWRTPLLPLLHRLNTRGGTLADWRRAFADLWQDAARPTAEQLADAWRASDERHAAVRAESDRELAEALAAERAKDEARKVRRREQYAAKKAAARERSDGSGSDAVAARATP